MRLARYIGGGEVAIVEEALPCLPEGGLLVRTEACGLCSGELMDWYMDRKVPHVLGHEVAGVVIESEDPRFPVGSRVFPHHHAPCLACDLCQQGLHVHCPQWKRTKLLPGGMAEVFGVPAENLNDTLVVDDLRPVDAALIEPLACVMKSLRSTGVSPVRTTPVPGVDELTRRQGAHLSHWTREGGSYFVTFRLADSVPAHVAEEWQREKERLEKLFKERPDLVSRKEHFESKRLLSEQINNYLDQGHGRCPLKEAKIAETVASALKHFDGTRYTLNAWCVMPNHVHVLVKPHSGFELAEILHSWKSFTAHKINKVLDRSGEVWQTEYYDHLIRNEEDFERCRTYILLNPAKAGFRDWEWVGDGADFQGRDTPSAHGRDARTTRAVIGLGVMGLMHMLALPGSVGYELNPARIEWARNLGLDARKPNDAEPADVVYVCPGNQAALDFALKIAKPGASVVLFAPMPAGEKIPLDLSALYFKDIRLLNSYSCGPDDTRIASEMIRKGVLRAEQVVSDFVQLEDLPRAYKSMKSGEILKPMVVFQ